MTTTSLSVTDGKITADAIDAMKARIGMVEVPRQPANRHTTTEAHRDTIRRYAFGIGDDNPLWCDPEYGPKTRWNSQIGFPTYMVEGFHEGLPAGRQFIPRGNPLSGLHAFIVGFETIYYRHIYPGDRCSTIRYIENVEEKSSEFSAQSIKVTIAARTKNQRGDVLRVVRTPMLHTERSTARKREKYKIKEPSYTQEEREAIDAAYAKEQRRGAELLYWEDVSIGDEIPPIVRGPYTLTDWIGYCMGSGTMGAFGGGPFRLDYLNRQRIPKFYSLSEGGLYYSMFACHFDKQVANSAGLPLPYDLGAMREAFLVNMLTNWMGDDGFLHKTYIELRSFNYLGDTQWCRGRVVGKRREGDLNLIDVDVTCENQRGETTTRGSAAVLLTSREHGAVRLPDPPRELP